MNAQQLAATTRRMPVRVWTSWRRPRDFSSIGRKAHVVDPLRSYDGPARFLAEAGGQRRGKVMEHFFKERPYLLPYIAVVVTIELIVNVFWGF